MKLYDGNGEVMCCSKCLEHLDSRTAKRAPISKAQHLLTISDLFDFGKMGITEEDNLLLCPRCFNLVEMN